MDVMPALVSGHFYAHARTENTPPVESGVLTDTLKKGEWQSRKRGTATGRAFPAHTPIIPQSDTAKTTQTPSHKQTTRLT